MGVTLELNFRETVSDFILKAITAGAPEEVAAFGTRGDGKTQGAAGVMVAHMDEHSKRGYPLPTEWLGVADTFQSHILKTHRSLLEPHWHGAWRLKDGGHTAAFVLDGRELILLHLFGVEDQSGMDRLRAAAHGLWFEEPAPSSVMVQSSGLSESAWGLGITSCRLTSYRHPKIMTSNYPDEGHWSWERFVGNALMGIDPLPGTDYVRIRPGEYASAEQRAEWERALANRPDMLRRLLRGQPGTIMLGPQVAVGFNRDSHVCASRPTRGFPVWLGQDGGHTPTTILAQRVDNRVRIIGALSSEHAGMRQHIQGLVRPWLGEHAPWALDDRDLLHGRYDPSLNTDDAGDIDSNPMRILLHELAGHWQPGPITWDGRKDPMLALLNAMHAGEPVLQIDPTHASGLVKALDSGWYYAEAPQGGLRKADTASGSAQPKKPNHPHEDYGDAFCYVVAGLAPSRTPRPQGWRAERATGLGFQPYGQHSYQKVKRAVGVGFNPIR